VLDLRHRGCVHLAGERLQTTGPNHLGQPHDQAKERSVGPPVISRSEKNLANETKMKYNIKMDFLRLAEAGHCTESGTL
jgi:hypothetical protein